MRRSGIIEVVFSYFRIGMHNCIQSKKCNRIIDSRKSILRGKSLFSNVQIPPDHIIHQSIDSFKPNEIKCHRTKVSTRSKVIVGIGSVDMFIGSMGYLNQHLANPINIR